APAAPVIPDDWNPFAPEPQSSARPVMGPAAGLGLPIAAPPRAESIDDLFGLGPMTPGTDPLGAAPAQALRLQPGTAGDADPLRALAQGPRPAPPATIGDEGSELHTPMPLPPAAAVDVPVTVIKPAGAVFSWDEAAPVEPHAAPRTVPGVRRASPEPPARPAVAPSVQAPAPARPAPAAAAAPDELLAALLDGLGAPGLRIEALTPARMHLVGELLRESVRGAVELLVARAALKREMRAQMTMIVARENNPLKFSPSVEVALQHLLGPPAPGFMAPAPAVRDAFDDLRAHQLGVMAGMRAALEGVLQRFDPAQLEGQLTRGSALASLIPSTRKARLWERFQELYAQLNREAQDDFDELFGKAFLRAYEEQLERLQHEPRG
nr:type VI secretion system-associated FHA domain protein TagH [Rubrivivax sp.]